MIPTASVRRLAVPGALVVALLAAGCGSSSSASSGANTNTQDAARVKLTQCLRDHGVDLPDNPGAGAATDIDQSKLQAAMQACRKYQQGAFGNISPGQRQQFQDAFAKFASCMRQHGVEVPTAQPGSGAPPAAGQLNQNDPKVRAASGACQSALKGIRAPGGGPAGG